MTVIFFIKLFSKNLSDKDKDISGWKMEEVRRNVIEDVRGQDQMAEGMWLLSITFYVKIALSHFPSDLLHFP